MKISVQMYTLREECSKDFEGALKRVAAAGYDGVEFAGYYGYDAGRLRELIESLGLEVSGTHTGAADVLDKPEETILYNKRLGNKNVIIPHYTFASMAEMDTFIRRVMDVIPLYKAAGMTLAYHNHDAEFKKISDRYIIDLIPAKTVGKMKLELDTFWAWRGGEDPAQYMKEHADDISVIHLKDGTKTTINSVGEGEMNIQSVIDAAKLLGLEWVVVENDTPSPDGFTDIERSMKNIKNKYTL